MRVLVMPGLVLLVLLVLLGACKDDGGELPYFAPSAVGLRFDGLLAADGSLGTAFYKGEPAPPTVSLQFVSEAYFLATTTADLAANSCVALAPFELAPASPGVPTYDGSPLFSSYETSLSLTEHTCQGRVDPAVWGEDAASLLAPFQGAHLGYGFGPMTEDLQEYWSSATLQELGSSMVASWVALDDAEGNWVAADWSTSVLFQIDTATDEILIDTDPETGEELLVPLDVAGLAPPEALPATYIQSVPNWYQDFALLDLEDL